MFESVHVAANSALSTIKGHSGTLAQAKFFDARLAVSS